MRILIPTVDFPPIEGGIATVALQLARELTALGHEVTVVAPRSGEPGQHNDGLDAFDQAEPYTIHRFGGYGLGWARLLPLWSTTRPLAKRADLILAINVAYGGTIARAARALRGTPYVTFAYAYEFLKFRQKAVPRALLRRVYRHAETTVAISNYTRRNLENFGADAGRITTIFPGAPPARPQPEERVQAVRQRLNIWDRRFVLAVGRFMRRKGHLTLVQAWPEVLEQCPNTMLVMAGRGPCREECEVKARAQGIEGFVSCPGYLNDDDLAALYQDCEFFALPTGQDESGQVEGFGLVFTEAHAYGKAVVAGRSGGVTDAVLHDETGLLVPPDDSHALAEAIIRLLINPEESRRLGNNGKRRVEEELNWRVFAERVMQTLESTTENRTTI